MNAQQLQEAMALLGYAVDVDYVMDQDYASIEMSSQEVEKPSEEALQSTYDAEQARLRIEDLEERLAAIPDLALAIAKYLEGKSVGNNDYYNPAGFEAQRMDSSWGWSFENITKPTIEDLESVTQEVYDAPYWEDMRRERDYKLSKTDFTQLADSPFSTEEKAAWSAYRAELRDLPENIVDIRTFEWPEEPA